MIRNDWLEIKQSSGLIGAQQRLLANLEGDLWRELRRELSEFSSLVENSIFNLDTNSDVVLIAGQEPEQDKITKSVGSLIRRLMPWRKGPFEICGSGIDSEWRSDLKWDRLRDAGLLEGLSGSVVADVGCNNGYYMCRMLEYKPEFVVGVDPGLRCFLQFQLLQTLLREPRLEYQLGGIDDLVGLKPFFDIVFCLGVVYHRRNPVESLRALVQCLKPGGTVIVESQVIPGDGPYALCPPGRYAKAPNVHFVPTADCLLSWMERAGFVDLELVCVNAVNTDEQRQTEHAPYESLEDFLDKTDPSKTVEGHPAPARAIVKGRSRFR